MGNRVAGLLNAVATAADHSQLGFWPALNKRFGLGLTSLAAAVLGVLLSSTTVNSADLTATIGPGHAPIPAFISGSGPDSYAVPSWGALETFEDPDDYLGTWEIGTVLSDPNTTWWEIKQGDQYGGASQDEGYFDGHYLFANIIANCLPEWQCPNGSTVLPPTQIQLNSPSNLIGFFWTAGEGNPEDVAYYDFVKVYSEGQLVGEFSTRDQEFFNLVKVENRCADCPGEENGGYNNTDNQVFAYVTLQAPDGVFFDMIEIGGTALELDNLFIGNTTLRFEEAERGLTEVVSQEETAIDFGLHGIFAGMTTACTPYRSKADAALTRGAALDNGSSIVPTADAPRSVDTESSDFCVSIGSQTAGISGETLEVGLSMALALRISDDIHAGVGINTQLVSREPKDYAYDQTTPMISGFIDYGSSDQAGLKLRASIAARSGELTYEREDTASGTGDLNSWGFASDLAFGVSLQGSMVLSPFAGIQYIHSTREEYTEDNGPARVRYEAVESESTSIRGGVHLSGDVSDDVSYAVTAGVKHQLSGDMDDFVAYQSGIEFKSDSSRTRETRFFGDANLGMRISESASVSLGVAATQLWEDDDIGVTGNAGVILRF